MLVVAGRDRPLNEWWRVRGGDLPPVREGIITAGLLRARDGLHLAVSDM